MVSRSGVEREYPSVLSDVGAESSGVGRGVKIKSRCGEMADATDLKSVGEQSPCGFESHHRYLSLQVALGECFVYIVTLKAFCGSIYTFKRLNYMG